MHASRWLTFSVLLVLCGSSAARAAWHEDGYGVATGAESQTSPAATSCGDGGAIVVWEVWRETAVRDIFAQKLSAQGHPLWGPDGVALSTVPSDEYRPMIVSDGAGGAIVGWETAVGESLYAVYAQRIDADGSTLWVDGGVPLSQPHYLNFEGLVADGFGGAIAVWVDDRSGISNIYTQRVDPTGTTLWASDGLRVCLWADYQRTPRHAADGTGGAIIIWEDLRGADTDLFAQRVSSSGGLAWDPEGVVVCSAPGQQGSGVVIQTLFGGPFLWMVAWNDARDGDSDVYAQAFNIYGSDLWMSNGLGICTETGQQTVGSMVSDGAEGAIIAWEDRRSGQADIYAQRVAPWGGLHWVTNGVPVCTAAEQQTGLGTISDGAGGAVLAWTDWRDPSSTDLYAQRISASGSVAWTQDGIPVSEADGSQRMEAIVASDDGTAIVVWEDTRFQFWNPDIYAQRLNESGRWGHPAPWVDSADDIPGDEGGVVKVNWFASDWDQPGDPTITHYSIWRATDAFDDEMMALLRTRSLVDLSEVGPDFVGPAYRVETSASELEYFWEFMGTAQANGFAGYRATIATEADSTSLGSAVHYFQVLAHTSDARLFWASNADSGYSVDDLAPGSPSTFRAEREGEDVSLEWRANQEPDVSEYAVYRSTSPGVLPDPEFFLATVRDTSYVDPEAPIVTLYYVITAIDVHENEGQASAEVVVPGSTGSDDPAADITIRPIRPNPVATTGLVEFQLAAPAPLHTEVFDLAGRRVATRDLGIQGSGWHSATVSFEDDAGRPLPSGVYYYRVRIGGSSWTRPVVLIR